MDPQTERMIRNEIRLRRSPIFLLLWLFFGSIAGFALIGGLGLIDKFFRTQGLLK